MKRLQVVLKQVMLRRRKDQLLNGEALIKLPKRQIEIVSCEFDASEREFYGALEDKMEDVIEKLMSSTKGNKYIGALTMLLRLRQGVSFSIIAISLFQHIFVKLVIIQSWCQRTTRATQTLLNRRPFPKARTTMMSTRTTSSLLSGRWVLSGNVRCARSSEFDVFLKLHILRLFKSISSDNAGEGEWNTHCQSCVPLAIKAKRAESERPTSAKIRMVLKLLRQIDERSDSEEKTIVFSQFTSMLDLLEPFLQDEGIRYVRCEINFIYW